MAGPGQRAHRGPGFALDEIDHIVLGEVDGAVEKGPLSPEDGAIAIARIGDVFELGRHRIVCGSATESETLRRLTEGDPSARLVLSPDRGHREFAMASGEMTDAEFLAFNEAWMVLSWRPRKPGECAAASNSIRRCDRPPL